MVVATAWSHKVDGVELNDFANYGTNVPEAENGFGVTVLLTEMQARTPVFNRQQPIEAKFTFMTYILADSPADYQALLDQLRALYGPGAHTYEWTPPGRDGSQSTTIYFDGPLSVDTFGVGAVTARAIALDPPL